MSINLIGNLNLMPVHQSEVVTKDTINNDSNLFEQLLLLSEQYSHPANKPTQSKSRDIDNEEFDDNNATDNELTIGGYPVAVEYFEREKLASINATEINAIENRYIPTNSFSPPTNKINSELLEDNLLTNLPTNLLDSEPANEVIHDKESVINSITQQNNFMSLFEAKRQADSAFINHKKTEINHNTSNYLFNSSNNLSSISDVMSKVVSPQTDFAMNVRSNDAITPIHQASSLSPMTNEPSLLSSANSTVTPYTMDLSTPVDVAQWQKSLTQHIMMFNRQGMQTAEIKLHPQELGSLHIKLAMTDDNINLHMMAAHNMVKGLLESALPFLRTSLQEQGFTLQQTDISDFSMMSDGEQSAMHHQNNHRQQSNAVVSNTVDKITEQSNNEKHIIKSGLSVFA
ncbi:hypothetical protein B6D12_12140 [Gilliamella apicola]|uniref:flagellar hook-length control protein FliK n=1 Tax=Gilliamella apicola TaxID=1196095 RepID=UPI000A35A55F|nr:flagellar hook-length control protein FliK [Gilliamella apicola]OTP89946.1 hypothetical protein B5S41_05405 [Gilliamella apicola]OTP96006.1 hypothetical protein B6D13_02765 [Gilliamella apicola]OTP96937.1 hypothetical protein B6D05_02125 [Gilliamella apicola]OTQ03432.1 hypothetical protein B6D07_01840 [Gilliamella apicola]OTQ04076.1 hypothetical protein B6D12_12140 [Gilliamella apicola]